MFKNKKLLGNTIKNYRKSKNISIQELAKTLNVSVGCISHIENGKNNVFKLDLLFGIIEKLDIPINEILLDNSLILDDIGISPTNHTIEIILKNIGTIRLDLLKEHIKIIVNTYLETILECNYNTESIEIIYKHIINELEYSKNLISLKK